MNDPGGMSPGVGSGASGRRLATALQLSFVVAADVDGGCNDTPAGRTLGRLTTTIGARVELPQAAMRIVMVASAARHGVGRRLLFAGLRLIGIPPSAAGRRG